jgi:hypothetical protein
MLPSCAKMEMMSSKRCPPNIEDVAIQYLAGRMSSHDAEELRAHIGVCPSCKRVVEEARCIIQALGDALPGATQEPKKGTG